MTITRRRAITLGSTAFGLSSVARAQTWPTGPVTLVVGYAAGGGPDINARGLALVMPAVTGQLAIVDNRAGAGGSIGICAAAGARPDGQTLLYATVANIVIIPWLHKGMIDTLTTLVPIVHSPLRIIENAGWDKWQGQVFPVVACESSFLRAARRDQLAGRPERGMTEAAATASKARAGKTSPKVVGWDFGAAEGLAVRAPDVSLEAEARDQRHTSSRTPRCHPIRHGQAPVLGRIPCLAFPL